jgi:hypothetical protein
MQRSLIQIPSIPSPQNNGIAGHEVSRLVTQLSQRYTKTREKAPTHVVRPRPRTKKKYLVLPSPCSGMASLSRTTLESQDSSSHQMRPSLTKKRIYEPTSSGFDTMLFHPPQPSHTIPAATIRLQLTQIEIHNPSSN